MGEIEPGRLFGMQRPVSGRWFDDLPVGLVINHVIRRTITEADNVMFATYAKVYPYGNTYE